jgi:hypothetical protein
VETIFPSENATTQDARAGSASIETETRCSPSFTVDRSHEHELLVTSHAPFEAPADQPLRRGIVLRRSGTKRRAGEDPRVLDRADYQLGFDLAGEERSRAAPGPIVCDPELRRIARPLFLNRDVVGVTQLLVWTARQSFLDKNRSAMIDFAEDTLRITRWFLNPASHNEVMAIAGRVTKQPPERFDWPFTKKDYYHAPDMVPNLDALQKNVAMMKDLGFVTMSVDVKKTYRPQHRRSGGQAPEMSAALSPAFCRMRHRLRFLVMVAFDSSARLDAVAPSAAGPLRSPVALGSCVSVV